MEKKPDFKAMSTKAKIGYVWDYYRWHILGTLAAVSFAGALIHHYVTYREPLLSVIMLNNLNSYNADASGFLEFQEAYGYDPEESPVSLASFYLPEDSDAASASYIDYQSLTTMIAAGGEDLFFGSGETYLTYCEQGALLDLSSLLPPELLEEYEAQLLYSTSGGETDPYPCAIELSGNTWLSKNGYYDTCYFGILCRSEKTDVCRQFAEFLLTHES